MSETEEVQEKPQRMVVVVAFDDTGNPAEDFDTVIHELKIGLSHKPNVQLWGAIEDRAEQVIAVLEQPDDAPLPR